MHHEVDAELIYEKKSCLELELNVLLPPMPTLCPQATQPHSLAPNLVVKQKRNMKRKILGYLICGCRYRCIRKQYIYVYNPTLYFYLIIC
jgi:hypothetical protein